MKELITLVQFSVLHDGVVLACAICGSECAEDSRLTVLSAQCRARDVQRHTGAWYAPGLGAWPTLRRAGGYLSDSRRGSDTLLLPPSHWGGSCGQVLEGRGGEWSGVEWSEVEWGGVESGGGEWGGVEGRGVERRGG